MSPLALKMKAYIAFSLFCSLAATQDLPIPQYQDAVPSLHSTSALWGPDIFTPTALSTRGEANTCIEQVGNRPNVVPDTDISFLIKTAFNYAATEAASNPPERYSVVSDWINRNGSNSDNTGYLTYVSSQLTSYNSTHCGASCNEISDCVSFVIYFERDPELVWPTTHAPQDPQCPAAANASSVTLIKCAFYSVPLYSCNATNVGAYKDEFHLVVAGSTAFNLGAPEFSGWTGPVDLGDASLSIPTPVGENGYLSVSTFPNASFDPEICADECESITGYDSRQNSTEECTSSNTYVLHKNGLNGGVTSRSLCV